MDKVEAVRQRTSVLRIFLDEQYQPGRNVTQQQSVVKAAEVRTVTLSPAAQTEATAIRKHIDKAAARQ
jgi:hypothetical protein